MTPFAFSVEYRESVRDRLIAMARADSRVIAGAEVGSRAAGRVDRWSDLDLTFGLAPGVAAPDVLRDWTRTLVDEFQAAHLFDLPLLSTIYRVFLLPGTLQVDISFTPGHEFGALGPKFKLLFGEAVERPFLPPATAHYRFGVAVHDAVRARFSIERGRPWMGEYLISGLRDEALALACLRHGLEAAHSRGYDQLPEEIRERAEGALVRSLDRDELLRALRAGIDLLLEDPGEMRALADQVGPWLRDLTSEAWPTGLTPSSPS